MTDQSTGEEQTTDTAEQPQPPTAEGLRPDGFPGGERPQGFPPGPPPGGFGQHGPGHGHGHGGPPPGWDDQRPPQRGEQSPDQSWDAHAGRADAGHTDDAEAAAAAGLDAVTGSEGEGTTT